MKKAVFFLTGLIVLFFSTPSMADVDFWPGWIYDQNAQYASWDWWQRADGAPDGWYEYTLDHENGLTEPAYVDYWDANTYHGTFGGREDVIETNGSLDFYFDNYDTGGPEKWVRVIVNYYAAGGSDWEGLTVIGFGVSTTNPYTSPDPEYNDYDPGAPVGWTDQGDGWIIAAYDFKMEPSPGEEWIQVLFGFESDPYAFVEDQVYVDEVQIHTMAVSAIPIPGALWLLGSGLVGLLAFRRKTLHEWQTHCPHPQDCG